MEKLRFKTIESAEEMDHYLGKVENYSGVRLTRSYASQGRIVGAYLGNKLVAGYMLITTPQFRSFLFVPDSVKGQDKFCRRDQFDMMEVNGLWIGPALKTPKLQIKVWLKLVRDIFLCRKNFVLLMRDARNKNMERFMGMANPKKIYEGSPFVMAGERTHSQIEVSYTTRWNIILNVHKYIFELLRRQKRANLAARERESAKVVKVKQSNIELA